MEEWLAILNFIFPLSPELQVALLKSARKEVHRRNKILADTGQLFDGMYYIEKGLIARVIEPEEGVDRIIHFYKEGEIIFHKGEVCIGLFRVIEEACVRRINKEDLRSISTKYPEFLIHISEILDNNSKNLESYINLILLNPKRRFDISRDENSWIVNDSRVKDYMLAAYLGFDKATFSRFRNGK